MLFISAVSWFVGAGPLPSSRERSESHSQQVGAAAVAPVGCPAGDVAIRSGGVDRHYVVTRPADTGGPGGSPPILLVFHGYSGSPAAIAEVSGLPTAAAARGWVVVAPMGSGEPSRWELQRLPAPDDVAFVRDVISDVSRGGCADPFRVAAAGHSNGAGFTARLMCELDLVASAMVGGANLGPVCDVPSGRPVVIAHGAADEVVPVSGGALLGGALHASPLATTIEGWRKGGADVRTVIDAVGSHAWTPGATEAMLAALAAVA